MLSISDLKRIFTELKNSSVEDFDYERSCQNFSDFFVAKFPEVNSIFSKFDDESIKEFCYKSIYEIYEEDCNIFKKGEECKSYYFICYGDINLYDEEFDKNSMNKLIKTISAGSVYGHKIKSNFNFNAVAKNLIHLIKIDKFDFDNLIEDTNKRKDNFKTNYLKKFFPKFRIYSDDIIKSLKNYFVREQYEKNSRIIIDKEYDEYVYLIIRGSFGLIKSVKSVKNLKEKLDEIENVEINKTRYVILEKLEKGDVFGVYSAIKHQKNNFTVLVLSDAAEVYKIPKSHCLFYFGGSSGIIPEALKGVDSVQQASLQHKIQFLETSDDLLQLRKFEYLNNENDKISENAKRKVIDENEIENSIKDAWKELENLGSKINEFKMNLMKPGSKVGNNISVDIFSKMKSQENEVEMKDNTKLMGFGTNRVVAKSLNKSGLSATQMKGMSTLQNICGVKKTDLKENDIINKLTALKTNDDAPIKSKIFGNIEDEDSLKVGNLSNPTNETAQKTKKLGFSLKNLNI